MKISIHNNRGVTLMEMIVVVAIIGILATIAIPNLFTIIIMHRARSAATDMLIKARYVRSLALASRRQLELYVNTTSQTFQVAKPAHIEYDLLEDLATPISAGFTNLSSYILYQEAAEDTLAIPSWNAYLDDDAFAAHNMFRYYVGQHVDDNAIDGMTTTCPSSTITFTSSGMIEPTCAVLATNNRLGRVYRLTLYKGGQLLLERIE